jgi:hypothetical protein
MPINPDEVVWNDAPAKGGINPAEVKWNRVPGAVEQGVKDAIGGALQSIIRLGSWLAPNSDFAKDARRDLPLLDQIISDSDAVYRANREKNGSTGFDWGRTAGNVVGSLPFTLGGGAAKTLVGRAFSGAGMGAMSAVTAPVSGAQSDGDYLAEKLKQAGIGAVAGGALPVVGSTIRAVTNGIVRPAAQRLADTGVRMTPGQILGDGWKAAEDKLSSVPLIGDLVKNRQRDSFGTFNRAVYDDALSPIGQKANRGIGVGSDSVGAVRDAIGDVYQRATPQAVFAPDKPFMTQLQSVRNTLSQTAPSQLAQFDNIVDQQIFQKLNGPQMAGQHWGDSRSMVGGIARQRNLGNATADDRALSNALTDLNDAMSESVVRNSPSGVATDIGNANAAWARYKRVEKAAGSAGAVNNGNVFTPAQYSSAVRSASTNGQRATNSGLGGQMADDAVQVLGNKYPDSGTAGRLAALASLGAGGAVGGLGYGLPALAVGAPLALAYSPLGQRMLQGALIGQRPAFIAKPGGLLGDLLGRSGGPAAASLLGIFMNGGQ